MGRDLMYVAVPGGPGRGARGRRSRAGGCDRAAGAAARCAGAALLALARRHAARASSAGALDRPAAHRDRRGGARHRRGRAAPLPRSGIPDIDAAGAGAPPDAPRSSASASTELRREQAESAALVESMFEGVIAADARGRIVTANPAGAPAPRLRARRCRCPTCPSCSASRPRGRSWRRCSRAEPVQDRRLEMDGRRFLINARPLPGGGAVLVLHDLTEIRRLETVRRDFVANVSHELKTPLTSISGYAETLLTDPPDPDTTAPLPRHHPGQRPPHAAAGGRSARPVAHRVGPLAARRASTVDVAAAAREVWTALAGRAAPAASSRVDVAPDGRDRPRRSRRAAADAHQPAGQLAPLLAGGGRIACRAPAEDGGVAVTVRDNGSGIGASTCPASSSGSTGPIRPDHARRAAPDWGSRS